MAYLPETTYAIARAARGGSLGDNPAPAPTVLDPIPYNPQFGAQIAYGEVPQATDTSVLGAFSTIANAFTPAAVAPPPSLAAPPPPSPSISSFFSSTTGEYVILGVATVILLAVISHHKRR